MMTSAGGTSDEADVDLLNTHLVMGLMSIIKGQKNSGLVESRPMGPAVFMFLTDFM